MLLRMQIKLGLEIVRLLGCRWTGYRFWHAFRQRSGLLKRQFPAVPWEAVPLSEVVTGSVPATPPEYRTFREQTEARFFFKAGELPDSEFLQQLIRPAGVARTLSLADNYTQGRFQFYGRTVHDLGWPVDWLQSVAANGRHDAGKHWTECPTFSPELGDIKDVWEPSRFACSFWLVRAYALSGKESYAEAFWQLFESWRQQNPPNCGPQWKCGQEAAIRLLGWCFALHAFWRAPATTPERVANMVVACALEAARISGNIDFSVSQKNNHGLSEAAGLITVGLLFPELRGASAWLQQGRRVFVQELMRQVYEDGTYVQNSMNYHRVMLHLCLWVVRLTDLNGQPLGQEVRNRVARATEFLTAMMNPESGRVPNYGDNDGALVLPLTACDYVDYRPTIQAANYLATGRGVVPPGPWDESLVWLFGRVSLGCARIEYRPAARRFDDGGYYVLRRADTWCLIRCHSYRDRPGHLDMLHTDLWHQGVNVLIDAGSYRYFCPEAPGASRYFRGLRAHNTVEVDDQEPMRLASHFLWVPWPKARCLQHGPDLFRGENCAYARAPWRVLHRREVRLAGDSAVHISDEFEGNGQHEIAVRWHFPDVPWTDKGGERGVTARFPFGPVRLEWEAPAQLTQRVCRGVEREGQLEGWASPYYGERSPAISVVLSGTAVLPVRIRTTVSFSGGVRA